jgi:autotransporter-associated beta strand protein
MKRAGLFLAVTFVVLPILALVVFVVQAADQTWSGAGTGNNTAWYTTINWVGGAVPGSSSGGTTNTDIATIPSTGTNPTIGINLNTPTNNTHYLGAINFTGATRTIGDSSGTSGTLQLNGATVNSVANVIIRNSGTGTLTLQNNGGGAGAMNIGLGNTTDNIINIDSSGGVTISSIISGTSKKLTLSGAGTGTLTLSGVNTYSGDTTISSGKLSLGTTGSIASSANIVLAGGATFDVSVRGGVTLGSTQGLKASGTNSTGTIATAASNGLTLGANSPLQFTAFNGSTAPLTISGAGTVTLASGNVVTVTVSNGSTPLGAGDYTLISKGANGSVAGTAPTSLTVNGDGIASGTSASLQITSQQLILHVVASVTPTISVSTTSLSSFGTIAVGSTSSEQSYTVSGSNLTDDITINASTDFQISTTSGSGFGSSVTLTQSGGSVPSTTIFARFAPGSTGAKNGNITHDSTGATQKTVAMSGTAISSEPTTQASNIQFSSVGVTSMTVSWTNGNGTSRIVLAKSGSAVNSNPVDGTSYTASTTFGSGTQIGTGNFVVFAGTGNSVTVTGLSGGTTYHFAVYEFNGSGSTENYLTISPATGNQATTIPIYRSAASGNWNSTASWEVSNDGGTNWTAAAAIPTSADGTITIRNGYTITVTVSVTVDELTVNSGGQITLNNGVPLTVADGAGTDLSVSGIFNSAGTITINTGASIAFNSGGKYQHNFTTTTGTIPTATWDTNSTVELIGYTSNTSSPSGIGQSFGNFIWNCPNQTANFNAAGNLTTATGAFTVMNTGTGTFRLGASTSPTLNIGGNFVMSGGTFDLTSGTGTPTINVSGNFNMSGGTLTKSGSGTPSWVFNKAGSQTFTKSSGTISGAINFTVNSGSTLDMGTNVLDGSSGTFTLSSGATLGIGSAAGITSSGATGNIQVSGSRSYNTGASYIYNGSAAQVTGSGLPSVVNNLTINNSAGVSLSSNVTIDGILALINGDVNTGALTLFMGNGATSTGTGDVIGSVNRSDLNGGTPRSFGNPFVQITETAGTVSDITVNLVKGSTPTDFLNSVKRKYTITPNLGTNLVATVQLHYLDSELNGNLDETMLQLWRRDDTLGWQARGKDVTGGNDSSDNWVKLSSVAQFSPWTISGPQAPTDVALMNFNALSDDQGNVLLEWQTGYEVSNLGFNVYRDVAGRREKLNPTILAGSVPLAGRTVITAGLNYVWMDKLASAKDYAQYWIEDVDLSGKTTLYGPVNAVPVTKLPDRARSLMLSQLHTNAASADSQRFLRPAIASSGKGVSAKPSVLDLQTQWEIAAKTGVKLAVRQAGWYRITQAELVTAGFDVTKDPRNLQLFSDGREVPMQVNGGLKGRLEPTDSIEFYGQALDTPSTNLRTYYLLNGAQAGRRIAVLPLGKGDETRRLNFTSTVERRDRSLYFPSLNNGEAENWFGAVIYSTPFNQTLTLRQVDADATTGAVLEVALQGLGSASPPVSHIVQVQVNGQEAGAMVFDGQQHQVSQFTISPRLLQEGANTVTLTATGGSSDFSVVDWLKLSYAHRFVADDNRLLLTATTGEAVRVSGFTTPGVRVFDLTDEANPTELKSDVELQGKLYRATAVAQGGGERVLLAVSDKALERAAQVTPQVPSSWHLASQGADVVMLTHGSLRSALEPLVQLRKQQGYAVGVVDVEDVYDEYSYGQHSAQAIQDFLAQVKNWKRAPRFVLLVGDASYDPKNYLGLGENDLVPTKVIWTNTFKTASDDWLADMNHDGVPEMAVGRLPVHTPEEATRVIGKITGYNNNQTDGALLVADRNDGFNFETASNTVQSLLPAGMAVQQVFRAQMDDGAASRSIIDAINRGPKLVNYAGHGSSSVWRGNLLTTDSVGLLTNQQALPVVISMTCLNNLFNDPRASSLGETLLLSAQGGAIAVWASSAQTTAGGQAVMNQEFIRQLFQGMGAKGQALTLGEAAMRAKAAVGDLDVRKSWILLGDPMMVIR